MSRRTPSLLRPLLAGLGLFLACSTLDYSSLPLAQRYLFGHWISQTTTAMFLVGVAAVAMSIWRSRRELAQLRRIEAAIEGVLDGLSHPAPPDKPSGQAGRTARVLAAGEVLDSLRSLPARLQSHSLAVRMEQCLDHAESGLGVSRVELADKLAGQDLERMAVRHALPRILVWAMPLLGFLGTVLGISAAMGQLEVGSESDLPRMMSGLQANLNVAFDTTAQALVLSVILMFGVFASERLESQLLGEVTGHIDELLARLERNGDPPAAAHAPDLSAGVPALFESLAARCAESWDRAVQEQFSALAREPAPARRIEAALLELTGAVGQLQRLLNELRSPAGGEDPVIFRLEQARPRRAA